MATDGPAPVTDGTLVAVGPHDRGAAVTIQRSDATSTVVISHEQLAQLERSRSPQFRNRDVRRAYRVVGEEAVERVALWVESDLAGYEWERILPALGIAGPSVRVGGPSSRADRLRLHPPFCWLHAGEPSTALADVRTRLAPFSSFRIASVDDPALLDDVRRRRVDLLTVTVEPSTAREFGRPSARVETGTPLSVSWFERLLHRWQVRAALLLPTEPDDRRVCLELAQDLVDRGGPAIGVGPGHGPAADVQPWADGTVATALLAGDSLERIAAFTPEWSWWGGRGRDRPLRLDLDFLDERRTEQIAEAPHAAVLGNYLEPVGREVLASAISERIEVTAKPFRVRDHVPRVLGGTTAGPAVATSASYLEVMPYRSYVWPTAEVLSEAVEEVPAVTLTELVTRRFAEPIDQRTVQIELGRLSGPALPGLTKGEPTALRVGVGPSGSLTPQGASTIGELVVWQPGEDGLWIDIAVSGLDFSVLGSAIQQVWLPRRGSTGAVEFTVVPMEAPEASLRVQLYGRGRLLQSYKQTAVVREPGDDAPELPLVHDPDTGELVRRKQWQWGTTDVDLVSSLDAPVETTRRVSVTINRHREHSTVTNRIGEVFSVREDFDPKAEGVGHAETLRTALAEMMGTTQADSYGIDDASKGQKQDRLLEQMTTLARAGNALFFDAFTDSARAAIAELGDDAPAEFTHLVKGNAIPWNLVYDRKVSSNPGEPALCPVGFEHTAEGTGCGTGECPVRTPEDQPKFLCPRGFWGLRHDVILPITAPKPDPVAPTTPRAAVLVDRWVAGTAHATAVAEAVKDRFGDTNVAEPDPVVKPALVDALASPDLAIAYFACHALPRKGSQLECLAFHGDAVSDPPEPSRSLLLTDLADLVWTGRPLVLLNACATAGFQGGSLPRILENLISQCGAGAVIGTEVSVTFPLAVTVGSTMLSRYLTGVPASAALLAARKDLLSYRNLLGLAWTIYADGRL